MGLLSQIDATKVTPHSDPLANRTHARSIQTAQPTCTAARVPTAYAHCRLSIHLETDAAPQRWTFC
jgi:hypothetical protein